MNKKKNYIKVNYHDVPTVCIDVVRRKGEKPVLQMYEPFVDEDGEVDWNEFATTYVSNRFCKRWFKSTMFEKVIMALKAFQDLVELDEMHRDSK